MELRVISSEEKKDLKINSGVKVISIRKGSLIDKTKLKPGFVITKVNDESIKSVDELMSIIKGSDKKIILEGVYEDYPGEYYYAFKQ